MAAELEVAKELLKSSVYFEHAPEAMVAALAEKATPVTVDDGHIFVETGERLEYILIIEQGQLARSRFSAAPGPETVKMHSSFRALDASMRAESLDETSVLIDTVSGRGHAVGLLHSMEENAIAYANVTAKGEAKVWLLLIQDFRQVIASAPEFSLHMLNVMAHQVRRGKNALKAIEMNKGSAAKNEKELKVLCYDATSWATNGFKQALSKFNDDPEYDICISMDFTTERLGNTTASHAAGYDAVCTFVNDTADASVMKTLSLLGVKMIAQRAAGFDGIDTKAALAYNMTVARVPAYSPYAVAEHAVALLMAVNRRITQAASRVRMANFTLDEGLMGMDIYGKTVGVMGTGKIGQILCNIMLGFGANLICYDVFESEEVKKAGGVYVESKDEIFAQSDVLFFMMPLLPPTKHTLNHDVLPKLKKGMILINTSRGGLVDTKALLEGIRSGIIGGVGMDVYENEADYFFQDWSARHVPDPDLTALLGNNRVVMTAHQAFFTKEAVDKIVGTTIENLRDYKYGLEGRMHPNSCLPAIKN